MSPGSEDARTAHASPDLTILGDPVAPTYYLLNEDTPIGSMDAYSVTVESLAAEHADALEDSLPGGAEVRVLRERREEAVAADKAWHLAFSLRVTARVRRDGSDGQARAGYGRLYRLVKRLRRDAPGAEELGTLLGVCPAPSLLTPAALVGAMERLARGAARCGAAFASFGITAASLAKLEDQRQALERDIKDLLAANGALAQASFHRKDRKQAFLRQLRLVEGSLQSDLPSVARDVLRGARILCLPRYSPRDPEEDEGAVSPEEDGQREGEARAESEGAGDGGGAAPAEQGAGGAEGALAAPLPGPQRAVGAAGAGGNPPATTLIRGGFRARGGRRRARTKGVRVRKVS